MGFLEDVGALYEARPYPPVHFLSPILQPLRRDDLVLLNYEAGYASCHGSLVGAATAPRILVAGCGTIEPVAVALANPAAEILAVDLSARSLQKLRWQARLRGVGARIRTEQADLESVRGEFDYVIATGVMHHLEDPVRALRYLKGLGTAKAVFRFMVYSRWGRDLLYGAKRLGESVGARGPAAFRALIAALPADHPYRIYFHLYGDSATDTGLADGYLHPRDLPFDAFTLRDWLTQAGLDARCFLHRPTGQPPAAEGFARFRPDQGEWERLAVLEALGELEENFCFFAASTAAERQPSIEATAWNPALPARGKFFSRLLGGRVAFDQRRKPTAEEASRLERALFRLPGRGL